MISESKVFQHSAVTFAESDVRARLARLARIQFTTSSLGAENNREPAVISPFLRLTRRSSRWAGDHPLLASSASTKLVESVSAEFEFGLGIAINLFEIVALHKLFHRGLCGGQVRVAFKNNFLTWMLEMYIEGVKTARLFHDVSVTKFNGHYHRVAQNGECSQHFLRIGE